MRWLMALFMLAMSHAALAGGVEQLKSFLKGLESFQADFKQTIVQGTKKERSGGLLTLQRPGKFRWDYEEPYPHLVLADATYVWIYDPDLEQVTRRTQAPALEGTPAQLLTNDVPIEKNFTLGDKGSKDGMIWVELLPKDKEGQYVRFNLAFKGDELRIMQIVDKFNQVTDIEFSAIKRNPSLEDDFFVFEPPEGVDVLQQ